MNILILTGFDRCGSSMIAKLLAKHPQINMLFQPFNSTEVHKTQYEIWLPEDQAPDTEKFLKGLLKGHLDQTYIAADWFKQHSTSATVYPDKLNVIKDTKLHFKVKWLKSRFPEIYFYGIWRDPRGIVCSLMRNDFYNKWYGEEAFSAIMNVIEREPLMAPFRPYLEEPLNSIEKMALIVAVRTHYMAEHLNPADWLIYEDILSDTNKVLNSFIDKFHLEHFDFSKHIHHDFNVSGKPFVKADMWKEFFSDAQKDRLNNIFMKIAGKVKI